MIQTTAAQAAWFVLPVGIIAIWVAWSDMKFMLIRNQSVLALMVVYLLLGPIALPLDEYLWRWSHFLVLILVGFIASSAGVVGAGDAKFAAAMAPLFAREDLVVAIMLFSAVLLGAFATHRIFRAIPAVRRRTPDWASWQTGSDFPMGLALSGTLMFYLLLALAAG